MKELNDTVAKEYDVEVMAGKANIEVRPKFVNKGEIVKRLVLHPHGAKQEKHPTGHCTKDIPIEELPDFYVVFGR